MPDHTTAKAAKPAKGEKPVGKVEHYYPKAQAAAVGLTDGLKVGDEIHVVGHGDDVRAKVKSLQIDHAPITEGHAGQHIGVGLATKVHEGDEVLLVTSKPAGTKAPKKAKASKGAKPARKAKKAKTRKPARKARKAKKPARLGKKAKASRPKRAKARKATTGKRRR